MKQIGEVIEGKEKKGFDDPEDRFARHCQKVDEFLRRTLNSAAYDYWAWCYGEGDSWAELEWQRVSDLIAGRVPKTQPWRYEAKDYR